MLESLRLCRNRAYHKVNSKRRQHLPASLSSYLLKEWQSMHPATTLDAKQLVQTYNANFEQADRERKRGRKKKNGGGGSNSRRNIPTTTAAASNSSNGIFMAPCGDCDDGNGSSMTEATQSTTNVPEGNIDDDEALDAAAEQDMEAPGTPAPDEASPPVLAAGNPEDSTEIPDEISDEFAPDASTLPPPMPSAVTRNRSGRRSKEDPSSRPVSPAPTAAPVGALMVSRWACPKHWVHMFNDPDKEIECIWTDRMLEVRESIAEQFPDSDLTLFKKPKGIILHSTVVLEGGKKILEFHSFQDFPRPFCKNGASATQSLTRTSSPSCLSSASTTAST